MVRVKIWNEQGQILYSDEPRLIGEVYNLDEDKREAFTSGDGYAEVSTLDGEENRFERNYGKLLEVYLPVRSTRGQPLLIETYQRYSSVAASGRRTWTAFAPVLLSALMMLELIQVPLARSLTAASATASSSARRCWNARSRRRRSSAGGSRGSCTMAWSSNWPDCRTKRARSR